MQRTWRHRVARLAHLKRLAFASGVLVCGWLIATDSRTRALFWYRPADDKLTWVKSNIGRHFESLAPRTRDLEKTFLFFCVLIFSS
jgi:cytochrome b561